MLKRRGCQSVSQFAPQLPTRNKRVKVARRRRRRLSRTFSFRNAVNTKRGRFATWSMQIGGGEKRGLICFRGTDCATISSQSFIKAASIPSRCSQTQNRNFHLNPFPRTEPRA